ncbi:MULTISPECIES: MBL fold metallo-hydrolase [unclassified Nocardiopsis]|uniref:MBL fold metallo-hydrolase n=1 Tax=unclassified Nocardiopsis TaxID=2649073 RepID=UPI00135CC3C9|nr:MULTISPECIES: MBL fold metallo-hydrolase [unclassified Nocardiopsis]
MREPYRVAPGIHALPSELPIPGLGLQPVNAFLVMAAEPMLIDAGMPVDRAAFEHSLHSLVDPSDLRWIVVTHDDRDHTGLLPRLLETAPQATLVTSPISVTRLCEEFRLPQERIVTANPGGRLRTADRVLSFHRPPVFDSPGTLAVHDHASGTLYSSDSFGTVLPEIGDHLHDHEEQEFFEGFAVLNRAIAPWTRLVDPVKFLEPIAELRDLRPERLLSSHAPAVEGNLDPLFEAMARVPDLPPWPPEADLEAALDAHETAHSS